MLNLRKINDRCEVFEDLGRFTLNIRVGGPDSDPLEVTIRFPAKESEKLTQLQKKDPESFDRLMIAVSSSVCQFFQLQTGATLVAMRDGDMRYIESIADVLNTLAYSFVDN